MPDTCPSSASPVVNANEFIALIGTSCDANGNPHYFPVEDQSGITVDQTGGIAENPTKATKFRKIVPTRLSASVSLDFNMLPDIYAPVQVALEDFMAAQAEVPVIVIKPGKRIWSGKGIVTSNSESGGVDQGAVTNSLTIEINNAFGYDLTVQS